MCFLMKTKIDKIAFVGVAYKSTYKTIKNIPGSPRRYLQDVGYNPDTPAKTEVITLA